MNRCLTSTAWYLAAYGTLSGFFSPRDGSAIYQVQDPAAENKD